MHFQHCFLVLLIIVHCTFGITPTPSPPKGVSLPSVETKNFLELKNGSWPSVDPKDDGSFYLRHLSRSHESFFNLNFWLLNGIHFDAPFHLTFRYWASHDLARIRVYLARGGHLDYLLDRANEWTDAVVSILPASSGRWTHLELLGADHPYTFAMKNATVHWIDRIKEEQHTYVCGKDDNTCRAIFEDSFLLISRQYVTASSSSSSSLSGRYIPVSDSNENSNSFALNLTLPDDSVEDYCLHFNFSTKEGYSLKVTANRLNDYDYGGNYYLEYRSYDGPSAKVCTSWLTPNTARVGQLLITFARRPYGQLDQFWVQLVKAELVKPTFHRGLHREGTEDEGEPWENYFVNVPPSVDLSKNGTIRFKLDQLHALKLDHDRHIVDLSTVWFNSVENSETKEKVASLRLTPSGDYQANYVSTEVFPSSPRHDKFGGGYVKKMFPKANQSQLAFFNCSDRFPDCRNEAYFKLTFRFRVDLATAVEHSVQKVNFQYDNVAINDPCVDPATGSKEKVCNGHGLCAPFPWKGTYHCLCERGFTGKQCEHAVPTTTPAVHQQTSKATTVKTV